MRNGLQRWRCKDCGGVSNENTGTIFSSRKLDDEKFKRLLHHIIRDSTLETISEILSISSRTAYIWRMKVYSCLSKYLDNVELYGKVWIDEAMIPVNRKDIVLQGNKLLRGNSRNQIIVCCGIDDQGHCFSQVSGRGHLSSISCLRAYGRHIRAGSILIHDGIFSHDLLVKELNLDSQIYKSTTKESKKKLQPVNSLIAQIKRNLFLHVGGNRKYLQLYLDWICFKRQLKSMKMVDKTTCLESICFQSGVSFKVKDRY
jgi:hypothetical protein